MLIHQKLRWATLAVTVILAVVTLGLRLGAGAEPAPPEGAPPTPTPVELHEPSADLPAIADAPSLPAVFVEGVTQDADTFNPVLTTNPTSLAVARKIFPALLGQDAQSGLPVPTGLAETWEPSPDGRSYTFGLRSDLMWSDGQPVTAWDVQFTFAALTAASVQSPYRAALESVEQVAVTNDHTVVVTFRRADCSTLHRLRHPLLPSHRYAVDFSDLPDNPLNLAPTVNAGPFRFGEWQPGEVIQLVSNPEFGRDAPPMSEWHYRIQQDTATQVAALMAGEIHAAIVPPGLVNLVADDERLIRHQDPGDSFSFIALNLADPQTPQGGQNAVGERVAQTPHPILGDNWVRRALALALDTAPLLEIAYGGESYRLPSYVLPTVDWAFAHSLSPLPHAPAEAAALLAEAGWVDIDGDGVRERDGARLALTLITNDDNEARVQMGSLVQAQLAQVGIAVAFTPLPFEQMAATLLNQQFDLALAGWENIGPDPAASTFWHSRDDQPGVGLNVVSFQDAEVDQWLDEAAAWPGCALAPRGERYRQVQQRLYERTPIIVLGGPLVTWAYDAQWRSLTPGPWGLDWRVMTNQ